MYTAFLDRSVAPSVKVVGIYSSRCTRCSSTTRYHCKTKHIVFENYCKPRIPMNNWHISMFLSGPKHLHVFIVDDRIPGPLFEWNRPRNTPPKKVLLINQAVGQCWRYYSGIPSFTQFFGNHTESPKKHSVFYLNGKHKVGAGSW